MVITVTLNPSLDKSGIINSFHYDDVIRVEDMSVTAGGKGVNVSRVLGLFGIRNKSLGFAGGSTGKEFIRMTDREKIKRDMVMVRGNTRTNWTLFDEKTGKVIKLNEPGPEISEKESEKLLGKIARYSAKDGIFVLSGSLPRGLKKDFMQNVLDSLRGKVKAVFLDSETIGKNLRADYIKPNIYEAERMLKTRLRKPGDFIRALKALKKYAEHPFISAGEKGLFLEDEDGDFLQMVPPALEHFTIPGAGDAFTAGFCAGLENGKTLTESAHLGTACASATVKHARFAGPDETEEMMEKISIRVIG